MNHKRKKAKHQRAGCLMCKPWKDERRKGQRETDPACERRRKEAAEQKLREAAE